MKKSVLSLVLAICMLSTFISALPVSVSAYTGTEYGNLYYQVHDNTVTITDCNESATSVDIPAEINGLPVTSIGDYAFSGCSSLTSISIPNSVTSIGNWAFSSCSSLTNISIPNGVTSIGTGAFRYCGCLYITADEKNKNYSSTDGVLFNKNKTMLIAYAKDKNAPSYTIPNGVTYIGVAAFNSCSSLTSVTMPNSVTSIGWYAFEDCSSLTNVTIPNSVTYIGLNVFNGCSSLTNVTIPNGITYIGDLMFSGCSSLTSISIPNSVTSIGNFTFDNCISLTNVTMPNSVTSIGDWAFSGCSNLTSVSIPSSVTSIGDYAFSSCGGLTDVYYSGTEEQWNNISIGSYNYCLTSATIHYNANTVVSDKNNANNYNEISANTQHNLPSGINDNIKVNKTGRGYAYFVLHDKDGNVYANRNYNYKIKGNDNTVFNGKTDINGIACVSTAQLSLNGTKAADKTYMIEFTNEDLLQNTFTVRLTLAPISYKDSWTGKATAGISAGLHLGSGGTVSGVNKSLGAEAELASIGASGKVSKVITLENIYKDGVRDLHLTSSTDRNIAANAKIGLYASLGLGSLGGEQALLLGQVTGDISTGYTLGTGYYIKNYNPNNAAQRQQIELFLLDTAMGLDGSNVVPRALINYWLEKNGMPTSNEESVNVSLLMKAGRSLPSIKLGNFSTSVAGMNADALYKFSKAKDSENKITTSTQTKVSADKKLFNTSYKGTANNGDFSIKTGSAVRTDRFINNSIQFSATTNNNEVEKIAFKTAEDSKVSSVFTDKSSTEYYKNISYSGNSAKNIAANNSFMNNIAKGNFAFFNHVSSQNVANDMTSGKYTADFTREKEVSEEFGQTFNFGFGESFGLEFGLTGTHKYSYTTETGIIDNGYEYLKSTSKIDEEIAAHGESLQTTLNGIISGMKSDLSAALDGITQALKEGVEWGKAKIKGAGDWVVTVTGFKKGKVRLRSYSIMSVNDENETIENASVSSTIGEPYIIEVADENGKKVTDFGENLLDLSLFFDRNDFIVADIPFTESMMNKLKIYYWNDEKGIYNCIGGEVDTADKSVSTKISKAGQYILAIDNCPPSVTDFKVSVTDGTMPTISANVADMSGIDSFSFKLDGEELVNTSTFADYYDGVTSTFIYKVNTPFEDNSEHTAEITAGDSSGNIMAEPAILTFAVDGTAPVITQVTVPEIVIKDEFTVSANAEDSNLANLIANVEYNGDSFSYPMTESDGVWTAVVTGMPKFARLKVSVKAYDEAGNCTESESKNVIKAVRSTEDIYIGVLDYENKNADILINNISDAPIAAMLIVNGYDEKNNLIETKKESVKLANGYITKNIALDNDCYKIRAELVSAENEENPICTGFSAYLNAKIEQQEPTFIVTLVDGENRTEMHFDAFNSLIAPQKEGYMFCGWYLSNDFDLDTRVEKLTTDFGESVTLYGKYVKNDELIQASLNAAFENNTIKANLDFDDALTDGVAYAEVFDYAENGDLVLNTSSTQEITAGSTETEISIPFIADNKNHYIKVSFFDDMENRNKVGQPVECEIFAEKTRYEFNGFYYYLTDDNKAEIAGCHWEDDTIFVPLSLDGHEVTKIGDRVFENCAGMANVMIPSSVVSIGDSVFSGCSSLTDIYYGGTAEEWSKICIGSDNVYLTKANIHYNTYYSVNGVMDSCCYNNNQVTANIDFDYIYEPCTVVMAIYDENNRLAVISSVHAETTDDFVSISCKVNENCLNYKVKVFFWGNFDNLKPLGKSMSSDIGLPVLESSHPYANNCDETKIYTYNGECESIRVTFSEDTETENDYDVIYIYDKDNKEIGQYSGTELSGATITVPGNMIKIRLTSDSSVVRYGYRTESIVVNQ